MPTSRSSRRHFIAVVDKCARELGAPDGWQEAHLSGIGAVAMLEAKLKALYGMDYAVCVANASLALLAVGMALDLRGVDFLTTPYTYGSSLAGLLLLGNRPVFADIEPVTLTLDPEAVRRSVTAKTRAILAVDIYGVPSDTRALRNIADDTGCWYIADAAQSLGATRDGLQASALADVVVTSFTVGKTLFAGEGGAIITNNKDVYEKLLWFTQHPQRQGRELGLGLQNEFALNCRMHPWAAVWANATFEESLESLTAHQERCFRLIEVLNESDLTVPVRFRDMGISPSFFRLVAAWRDEPRRQEVTEVLGGELAVALSPAPVSILYTPAAFAAACGTRFLNPRGCKVAEDHAQRVFCVIPA